MEEGAAGPGLAPVALGPDGGAGYTGDLFPELAINLGIAAIGAAPMGLVILVGFGVAFALAQRSGPAAGLLGGGLLLFALALAAGVAGSLLFPLGLELGLDLEVIQLASTLLFGGRLALWSLAMILCLAASVVQRRPEEAP